MPQVLDEATYLDTLLGLSKTLNSSLDISEVLNTAIEQVTRFVGAERGFILLVQEGSNKVWGKATHDIDPNDLELALAGRDPFNRPQISKTIVEEALRDRLPVVSLNAQEDPRYAEHTSVRVSQVRSVVCVPLVLKGKATGIVYLDNRLKTGVFDDRHVEMLTAFANQAAVAIENARLYNNLKKSMEEQLRLQSDLHEKESQRRALEEANRLKSEFIGFVSHELRNPLTTIRGYVQTLSTESGDDPAVRTEFYEVIEAEADRMLDMINELLDSSRLEAGRPLTLNSRPIDLRPMLSRLARTQRFYKYWTPGHCLEADLADDLPVIEADEDKVHQVIANLLSNAIKYSPNGGVIALSAAATANGGIRITVQDEGLGMSEDQRAKLFGRYERIERDEIKQIAGTGLGLFLSRHLIELHGGSITCECAPGHGSIFIVELLATPPQ